MSTPAQAHFMRVAAAQASAEAAAEDPIGNASAYELMLLKLAEDRRRLKLVQSMEAKAALKRQLLPDYAPWVEGAIAAGRGGQDDVLMTVMLWRIDAGDHAGALDIADYALPYGLTMPDRYHRTTATTVAEEIADAAHRARDGRQDFDVEVLQRAMDVTADSDMPDPVRAKLHKEIGLLLYEVDKPAALLHLQRATQLHDGAGVKKQIEKLERDIQNTAAAPASA